MPAPLTPNQKPHSDEQHFDISSLYIVKSEINAALNQVEAALSLYISDHTATVGLFDSADAIKQVSGILQLLYMDGAVELSNAIQLMLVHIAEHPESTDNENITVLSEGLMTLSRYLEFVLLHETLSPLLLLPITNAIRLRLQQPAISEGHYVLRHLKDPVAQSNLAALTAEHASTAAQGKEDAGIRAQLARLYQAGLSAILRDRAQTRDYTLVQKATSQMTSLATSVQDVLYWKTAAQVIGALSPTTPLTDSRKRVLAQIERRIANKDSAARLTPESYHSALADLLAMTAIAPAGIDSLATQLKLPVNIRPDQDTLAHKQFLFGPDQEVIQLISQLVHQDIIEIKEQVDLIVNEEQQPDGLATLAVRLKELGQRLEILTLNYAGKGLVDQSNTVAKWPETPDEEQINTLMDRLLDSENAITLMEQTHTPGLVMLPFTNLRISLHQLVNARHLLVTESRTSLAAAKQAILSYIQSEGDLQYVEGLAVICEEVSGAMAFLNAPRGQAILLSAAQYIKDTFKPEHERPESQAIAHLSDAIVTVDYVLEGLENKQPTGETPYHVGEHSLELLGYPVTRLAA